MAKRLAKESASALMSLKNGLKTEIKEELDNSDDPMDDDDAPVFGPAAMGLKRVGEEMPPRPSPQPCLALNRRGMPARIRKKNRLFFDDDDPPPTPSPRASPSKRAAPKASPVKKATPHKAPPTPSPAKKFKTPPAVIAMDDDVTVKEEEPDDMFDDAAGPGASPDRKCGQKTGMRLRNMLKLPKAHKWVVYEWFYSNIDRPLYFGANDFLLCVKESFPSLAVRRMRRVEWCLVRRMMGKPRRCSQAFFQEERNELDRKRAKIRLIQQRKIADPSTYQDLPNDVPVQLVIGSKVTARLRKPQDGLFAGSIDAVDTSNNTYRITFDRPGLGTHSVPDYEVLSQGPPETMSLSSYINKFRPRPQVYVPPPLAPAGSELTYSSIVAKATAPNSETYVGAEYTLDLLKWMVRMEKLLERKRDELCLLVVLNRQAEQLKCGGSTFPDKFQGKYAATVVRLEELNYVLHGKLQQCQLLLQDVAIAPGLLSCASLSPTPFRNRSVTDAAHLIETLNASRKQRGAPIKSQRKRDLMQQLAALLLLVQQMSTNPDHSSCDVKVLQDSLDDIRKSLVPANQKTFEDFVEVHMHHIMFQLNRQMVVKHPFMILSK